MSAAWTEAWMSALESQPSLVIFAATLLAVLLATRFTTGIRSTYRVTSNGIRATATIPYWLPFLGHVPQLATNPDGFLRRLRRSYPNGVFNLSIFGSIHSIVYKPSLAKALLSKPDSEASSTAIRLQQLKNVFGLPTSDLKAFEKAIPQLVLSDEKLITESEGDKMVHRAVELLRHNIADFVTFNNSQVDQSPWEIHAGAAVEENPGGEPVVEADLLELVRNFVAITSSHSLLGSDFVTNFPEFWTPFWEFDAGYLLMTVQWPRWLPSAKLNRARGALNALLGITSAFETALEKHWSGEDPGSTWQDIDDVGAMAQSHMDAYREHGISIRGRAAYELASLWTRNSHVSTLVFWILCRIHTDSDLLSRIRTEISPFLDIFEPSGDFGPTISEPVRFKAIDIEGITMRCPLLLAAYTESLRLDVDAWSSRYLTQDVILGDEGEKQDRVLLQNGTYAHVAHDLVYTDPALFEEPLQWRTDRYDTSEKSSINRLESSQVGDIASAIASGTLSPPASLQYKSLHDSDRNLGSSGMATVIGKEVLIFVAAILTVWDVETAGGGTWKLPPQIRGFGTRKPRQSPRVWVKQRTGILQRFEAR